VQQRPQRPFVPHQTSKASRPGTTRSEFRLARPFVPRSSRDEADAAPGQPVVEIVAAQRVDRDQLPPIEVFLDDEVFPGEEESHELPPVEHFMDPLPAAAATGLPVTEAGWGADDWQRYDWRGAATLGDGVESQASNEWATTNWDVRTPGARKKLSAAQAVANALDQIAQQIREGDLTIPSSGGSLTDPGAIAASLAALLGVRR
jgi:hypothetical protein